MVLSGVGADFTAVKIEIRSVIHNFNNNSWWSLVLLLTKLVFTLWYFDVVSSGAVLLVFQLFQPLLAVFQMKEEVILQQSFKRSLRWGDTSGHCFLLRAPKAASLRTVDQSQS